MKQKFGKLATLMVTMTAPMITSCSNELDVTDPAVEVKSNIVTITIAPPVTEPESRIAIDGSLMITGWESTDEVVLYKVEINSSSLPVQSVLLGSGITFTCVDATNGTFSGDIGSDDINDYNLAVFGGTIVQDSYDGNQFIRFAPNAMCSENLKDVVMMTSWKSNDGNYSMKVVNNVMKIQNVTPSDKTVAWYGTSTLGNGPYFFNPVIAYKNKAWESCLVGYYSTYTGWENANPFTLKSGVNTYLNMCPCTYGEEGWGLAEQDGTEFLPIKSMAGREGVTGKLYNAGVVPTKGTAKRTGDIEVPWVQLWMNGPKFAAYNVGANSETDYGGLYSWGMSIDKDPEGDYKQGIEPLTGTDDTAINLWGSNWRMPTAAELQAFADNCDAVMITKNGVNGFKYTGKGDFSSNSVFLPAAGYCDWYEEPGVACCVGNQASYWSSTPDTEYRSLAYYLSLGSKYVNSDFYRGDGHSVRAILAE